MHHAEIPLKTRCDFTHHNRNRATNINGIYNCAAMFFHPQRNVLKMRFVAKNFTLFSLPWIRKS